MGSLLSKAVQVLSKNWKKLVKPFAAIASLLGAAGIGAGIGTFFERKKAEKDKAKWIKELRNHEAMIQALEAQDKKSFRDKWRIKKLENEVEELKRQLASVEETLQNV